MKSLEFVHIAIPGDNLTPRCARPDAAFTLNGLLEQVEYPSPLILSSLRQRTRDRGILLIVKGKPNLDKRKFKTGQTDYFPSGEG